MLLEIGKDLQIVLQLSGYESEILCIPGKGLSVVFALVAEKFASFGNLVAMVKEFDGLFDANGNDEAYDDGGDVNEEVAPCGGGVMGRVDVEHGSGFLRREGGVRHGDVLLRRDGVGFGHGCRVGDKSTRNARWPKKKVVGRMVRMIGAGYRNQSPGSLKNNMTKQSLLTVTASVVLSVVASTITNLAFERQREPILPDVVRAKRMELVDELGRIRGVFELTKSGQDSVQPRLVMRNADGSDSIEMGLDSRGDGALGFSNDYWNEGAVILGHLQNVDDGTQSTTKAIEDKSGAWGLRVRSPKNKFTDVGFLNSGRPMVPLSDDNQESR